MYTIINSQRPAFDVAKNGRIVILIRSLAYQAATQQLYEAFMIHLRPQMLNKIQVFANSVNEKGTAKVILRYVRTVIDSFVAGQVWEYESDYL